MKMKRKSLKKLNILNRNLHIKNYSSYLIYTYLSNYNLKLALLSNNKSLAIVKKKINSLLLAEYTNQLKIKKSLYVKVDLSFLNNKNDKYFKTIASDNSINVFKNRILAETGQEKVVSNFVISETTITLNFLSLFKTIMHIVFITNLIKIFEIYKICLLLWVKN